MHAFRRTTHFCTLGCKKPTHFEVERRRLSAVARPCLKGRDLINGDLQPEEIKSILWTASDLRERVTEKKEKFSYLQGKMVGILQEPAYADSINSLAVAKAAYILGGNVAKVSANFEENDASDAASALSAVCEVVAVSCGRQAAVQSAADGSPVPTVCLGSSGQDPLAVLAELMAALDHYTYLKRLTVSWVGPARARLYSYLQLLPSLGLHLRYCCPETEDVDPEEYAEFVRRTIRHNTQFSRHVTPAEATYRAHVLTTTCHQHQQLRVHEKHAAEADLDWTFVQDLPRSSAAVSSPVFLDRRRSLVRAAAACRAWVAAAALTELTTDQHRTSTARPNFEGQG